MNFKKIVMKRYAAKKFDGKKVPEAKVNELSELIRFTPSALNLQPWKIKVITDQKIKEQLLPFTFNQIQVSTCSHLLIFCANTDIDGIIKKIDQPMRDAGIPDEMRSGLIGFAMSMNGGMSVAQKLEWAQRQVFLALGNAVNGAKALGFDSCPMTGFSPNDYSRILNLPANLIPTALCPIGYAADKPLPKVRFPKEEILL